MLVAILRMERGFGLNFVLRLRGRWSDEIDAGSTGNFNSP